MNTRASKSEVWSEQTGPRYEDARGRRTRELRESERKTERERTAPEVIVRKESGMRESVRERRGEEDRTCGTGSEGMVSTARVQ